LAAVAGVQEEFLQHSPDEFFQTSPPELRQLLISCATAVVARATVATNIANWFNFFMVLLIWEKAAVVLRNVA
jgi:hypothetical protein